MFSRAVFLSATFIGVMVFGIFVGYSLKPQIKVEMYDHSVSIPSLTDLQKSLKKSLLSEYASNDAEAKQCLASLRKMRPLVKAGPFFVAFNPENGDYLIEDLQKRKTVAWKITLTNDTSIIRNMLEPDLNIDASIDKDTGRLLQASYNVDFLDHPTKYSYIDNDGDGRFDIFIDFEEGVIYRRKDLQWLESSRLSTKK